MNKFLLRQSPTLAIVATVAIAGFFLTSSFFARVGALTFIAALAALGLNLLMGYAGQISLGHAGFFAIGGYACAILPTRFGVDPLLAAPIGACAAALLAFAIGGPILRLKGHYLAVATLGLGFLINLVLNNEAWLTGGPEGMAVKRAMIFGWRLRDAATWYWISGGALILGAFFAVNLIHSPTGRALRALRDSPIAAQTLGVNIGRHKLLVFVVSAFYAAGAGAIAALFDGLVTPTSASFLHSVELVTMVVVGGAGSIFGSFIGAAFFVILPQVLTAFEEYETLMLGLAIILFMILMKDGIAPSLEKFLKGFFLNRKSPNVYRLKYNTFKY